MKVSQKNWECYNFRLQKIETQKDQKLSLSSPSLSLAPLLPSPFFPFLPASNHRPAQPVGDLPSVSPTNDDPSPTDLAPIGTRTSSTTRVCTHNYQRTANMDPNKLGASSTYPARPSATSVRPTTTSQAGVRHDQPRQSVAQPWPRPTQTSLCARSSSTVAATSSP